MGGAFGDNGNMMFPQRMAHVKAIGLGQPAADTIPHQEGSRTLSQWKSFDRNAWRAPMHLERLEQRLPLAGDVTATITG